MKRMQIELKIGYTVISDSRLAARAGLFARTPDATSAAFAGLDDQHEIINRII